MNSITIKEAQQKLNDLIEEINNHSSAVLIVNDKGVNGYLVSEEFYCSLIETIYLNSFIGLAQSIVDEGNSPLKSYINVDDVVGNKFY